MSKHEEFLERYAKDYRNLCDDDLHRVYAVMARRQWPVDNFIDWFRSARGGDARSFCVFFRCMYDWVVLRDKTQLCLLVLIVGQKNYRAADHQKYYDWLVGQLRSGGVSERFLAGIGKRPTIC